MKTKMENKRIIEDVAMLAGWFVTHRETTSMSAVTSKKILRDLRKQKKARKERADANNQLWLDDE